MAAFQATLSRQAFGGRFGTLWKVAENGGKEKSRKEEGREGGREGGERKRGGERDRDKEGGMSQRERGEIERRNTF